MNYNANYSYGGQGAGYSYGSYNPYNTYQTPAQQSQPTQFDPVALQIRIVKARQINLMCKQALVRNAILQNTRAYSAAPELVRPPLSEPYASSTRKVQPVPPTTNTQPPRGAYVDKAMPLSDTTGNTQTFPGPLEGSSMKRLGQTQKVEPAITRDRAASREVTVNRDPTINKEPAYDVDNEEPDAPAIPQGEAADDDSVPIDQAAPARSTPTSQEGAKVLSTLAESMTQTVTDSGTALKKLNAKKNRLPPAERAKRKMENMFKVNANAPPVMPLWRHKLNGRPDPPKETILKGVRLFCLVVRAVLLVFIKPNLSILKRKLNARENERKDLQKSLKLVAESFDDWLGKLVQLPVSSVAQDGTLNFEPVETLALNAQPLKTRLLQLKVRLRAVVLNIAKSEMPSDFITDSLISLVEDGNYFTTGMLWDLEVDQLDFNSLGATRNMIPSADDPDPAIAAVGSGKSPPQDADKNYVSVTVEEAVTLGGNAGTCTVRLDARRARLVLQNFLFVRALISRLLLSPWCHNLCAPPSQRSAKKILYNHRMLATAVYELLRSVEKTLPIVGAVSGAGVGIGAVATNESIGGKFIVRPATGSYRIGDAFVAEARRKQALSPSPSASLLPGLPPPPVGSMKAQFSTTGAQPTGVSTKGAIAASETPGQSATLSADGIAVSPADAATPADSPPVSSTAAPPGMFLRFTRLIGIADDLPAVEALSQGSIESVQLEPRADYPTLQDLHALLLSPDQLAPLRVHLDEWFTELRRPLDDWLQRLVVHVLTRKLKHKMDREAAEKESKEALHG